MNEIFCGTLEIQTKDSSEKKENDLGTKLYKIELSKFQELVSFLIDFLTPFEHDRANRYHFEKDRNRFIICRIALKFILAEHIGLDVNKILIDANFNKKPYLPSHPSVFFNITHAGDYAIIAIANSSIGVDIEYVNNDFDYKEILPSVFNTYEIDELSNSIAKHRTFYQFWTRKEAIVKATGKGIDDHILEIMSLDGYHHIRPELLGNFDSLQVFSFELNKDYIGAVAFSGTFEHRDKLLFCPIPIAFEELLINR